MVFTHDTCAESFLAHALPSLSQQCVTILTWSMGNPYRIAGERRPRVHVDVLARDKTARLHQANHKSCSWRLYADDDLAGRADDAF
jgi:hypothetical protein